MVKLSNQSGFSAIGVLLVLVIVGIVGGTGFYVYHAQQSTYKNLAPTSSNNPIFKNNSKKKNNAATTSKTSKANSTTSWVPYTSKDGSFTLKYPNYWVTASNPVACSDNIVLLAPNASSVGACGSGNAGEVEILASTHGCFPLSDGFSGVTQQDVTVSGVSGKKYTGTSTGAQPEGPSTPPAGSRAIQYCFNTSAMTYSAGYVQQPSYPDGSSDFNSIVMQTLKFNK